MLPQYPYSQSYEGQCCQLLLELSGQFGGKHRPQRKKLNPPNNFHCFKGIFALEKKLSLSLIVKNLKLSWTFLDLERLRGEKKIPDVWPLFSYFCTKSAKICSNFVWMLHFLFGPFWVLRPNNRPVGNCAADAAFRAEQLKVAIPWWLR